MMDKEHKKRIQIARDIMYYDASMLPLPPIVWQDGPDDVDQRMISMGPCRMILKLQKILDRIANRLKRIRG
jgi:hypothetical protein